MTDLGGKSVWITGASGGIGAATAWAFAEEGAKVLVTDLAAGKPEKTAESLTAEGAAGTLSAAPCDVTDEASVAEAVETAVRRHGGLDVAVLNAGIEGEVHPIAGMSLEAFEGVLSVNLRGVFLGLKYAMPAMKERGGCIVITASVAGVVGTANLAPYTVSKHGVIGLMRCAALEGAADNIRVNTVNPGPVETRMMRSLEEGFAPGHAQESYAGFKQTIPLNRYADPTDVAAMIVHLASAKSAYLTGGVYMVDGGMTAGLVA